MHVLIPVHFNAPLGGLQSHVVAQIGALRTRGHACTVVCAPGPFAEKLRGEGVRVVEAELHARPGVDAVLGAGPTAGFDVVHAHASHGLAFGAKVASALDIPLLVTCHSVNVRWLKPYADRVAGVLAVSPLVRDAVQRETEIPAHRVLWLPNGVDRRNFFREGMDDAELWQSFPELQCLPNGARTRTVAVVTRFDEDKRFILDALRAAWQRASESLANDLNWWVVGDGALVSEAKAEAKRLEHVLGGRRIAFLGWRDSADLRRLYSWADIVVGPGRCALEAMSCGTPVLAIGSRGYVGPIDGERALLGLYTNFGGGDSETPSTVGLYEDIDAIIYDDEERDRVARAGARLVAAFFDQEALDRKLVALYENLVAERSSLSAPGARWEEIPNAIPGLFPADEGGRPLRPWHWTSEKPARFSSGGSGRLAIRCDLEDKKAYLQLGKRSLHRPPTGGDGAPVRGGSRYRLVVEVGALPRGLSLSLWVIEYDLERRVGHHDCALKVGENALAFRTRPETRSLRIGFRFAGSGATELGMPRLLGLAADEARRGPAEPKRDTTVGAYRSYRGENLVVIVGPPRSGTTWLLQLISGHPGVVAASVENLNLVTGDRATLETNVFNPSRRQTDNQIRWRFWNLSRANPGKVVVEKTPIHLFSLDRILEGRDCPGRTRSA